MTRDDFNFHGDLLEIRARFIKAQPEDQGQKGTPPPQNENFLEAQLVEEKSIWEGKILE